MLGDILMVSTSIEERFVELVRRCEPSWPENLASQDEDILREVLRSAGFVLEGIRPYWLKGHYREQGGDATGETYPINRVCPYAVFNDLPYPSPHNANYRATGWLDDLVIMARKGEIEEAVIVVGKTIRDEQPLKPIQISQAGDILVENEAKLKPQRYGLGEPSYQLKHLRDEDELENCRHHFCGGEIIFGQVTEHHTAIVCRACNLRILIPLEVKTFGDLRTHMWKTIVL